ITADGVFGAGRVIRYVNVETVSIYGMEGDDVFHVLSTNPAIQLNVYGGLGSDRVEVGGQAPAVQANDLLGHTGLIRHSVESTVGAWDGVPVDGIATEIMDDDEPTVVLAPVGGSLVLVEGATGQLSVRLTFAPTTTVTVTLTGPPANPLSGGRAAALEFWNGSTWETSITLTFLAGDTAQRLVTVRAAADLAGEGERMHGVDAIVAGGTYERALVATLFVRVLDDEAPAVNVVVPDGGVGVVEPSAGSVGTMDSVTVSLTRAPVGTVSVLVTAPVGLMLSVNGTDWSQSLTLQFSAVGSRTLYVSAVDDSAVEGQQVARITAQITSVDAISGTVTGSGGLPSEIAVSTALTPGALKGLLVAVTDGFGDVRVRRIWNNTTTMIEIEGEWTTAPVAGNTFVVLGYTDASVNPAGIAVAPVTVLVHDGDTPGVVITPVGGPIRLVEGAIAGQFGATGQYEVRLTMAPTANVTVTLTALVTSTLSAAGTCGYAAGGCSAAQVEFWDGSGWGTSLTLTFTPGTWATAQTVLVRAIQDTRVDGSLLQAFADSARRTHLIQGPLFVSGGEDDDPPEALYLDEYLPIAMPGETSGHPLGVTATTSEAIETAQVDTLIIHNEDSPADETGTLTSTRITGLGMAPTGIEYALFEDLTVLLGYGDDSFTVETTHAGTTTIRAGLGSDTITVLTIDGHTRVIGGPDALGFGRLDNDTFTVGTAAGLLDLLAALLVLEGGVGTDVATLRDFGDDNDNLGWLTQDTVTGLDMAPRPDLDEVDRPLDRLYSVTPVDGATTFTVMLSQVVDGVADGIGAVTFAVTATAEQVRAALQALLFPPKAGVAGRCGEDDETACSLSVYVWKVGGTFLIGFRGEVNESTTLPVTILLSALGAGAAAVDADSRAGIRYVGLETLNVALGSGADVLNIQGTLPVTNVSFGAGDDRVYVSSEANVGATEELGLAERPEFLAGDLDAIEGTLNLDLGAGRHTLLVSDEGAGAGDGTAAVPVLITDVASAAITRDADLAANGEIFVVGLAPAGLSWRTNTAAQAGGVGNLADGVRIWTSGYADTIVIDGTHERAGVRTTTWLNTGLGNDNVTVALTAGQDGFFVLNTQGPNDNLLDLSANLDDGDEPVAPDVVHSVVVTRGASSWTIDPSRYVVSSRLDMIGLFDSLLPGDVVTVTLQTATWTVQSDGTFDLGTLAGLVGYRVWVNGRLLTNAQVTLAGTQLSFAAPAQRDGSAAHVVVEVTRTSTEQFTMPATGAILPAETMDDDVVHAETSSLPLVIFGGIGEDGLNGGTGGDIVFGDRGLVQWVDPVTGAVVAQSGNGGVGDFTDGAVRPLGLVTTVDPTIGGDDVITTGVGADIVLGGAGGDQITTNRGETSSLPDASGIVFGDNGVIDWVSLDANTADVDRVWSTDPARGGADTITTGRGDDLVVGGTGGDTITVSDGRNVVLGDNGRFTATSPAVSTPAWGALSLTAGRLETTDPTVGGGDTITSGAGIDLVLGGAAGDIVAVGANDDVVVGDHGFLDLAVRAAALRVITVTVTDNG
ncbi:MAG TPA: calcium-binding protein, partial [Actinotalea sp.]|nr:calcium-binding protein [Actinotalea sp.]